MDTYGQDVDLVLLTKLLSALDRPTAIDVGAEQGAFAKALLSAGAEELHAFEPHPANAQALQRDFADDPRVTLHREAVSDVDGEARLHVSSAPGGGLITFGHTLLEREDTDEIAWTGSVTVETRSLESLVATGDIPAEVGILKVDTDGHDLQVIRGMGSLDAEIVMVEHWSYLPQGLGECPWTTQHMVDALRGRGFGQFLLVVHRDDLVSLKWNDGEVEAGDMGNLLFLHDRVLERLLPTLVEVCASVSQSAITVAQRYRDVAAERLAVIGELERTAEERLALIENIQKEADDRLEHLETTTAELVKERTELDSLRAARIDRSSP